MFVARFQSGSIKVSQISQQQQQKKKTRCMTQHLRPTQ